MNAQPPALSCQRYCIICGEPFDLLKVRGHWHRKRCSRYECQKAPAPEVQVIKAVAIRRICLHCHSGFVARDPVALYCGLNCYVEHNCRHKKT